MPSPRSVCYGDHETQVSLDQPALAFLSPISMRRACSTSSSAVRSGTRLFFKVHPTGSSSAMPSGIERSISPGFLKLLFRLRPSGAGGPSS